MKLIGLTGAARSGKTTVSEYLEKKYGYKELSFATPLKETIIKALAKSPPPDDKQYNEVHWRRLIYTDRTPFTRWLMQFIGTDIVRDSIDPTFWTNLWNAAYIQLLNNAGDVKVVIPDVRFPNEASVIKKRSGEIWRVVRTDFEGKIETGEQHASETEMVKIKPDKVIAASTGIENLYKAVDGLIGEG